VGVLATQFLGNYFLEWPKFLKNRVTSFGEIDTFPDH